MHFTFRCLVLSLLFQSTFILASSISSSPLRVEAQAPLQSLNLATQLRSGFVAKKTEFFATFNTASIWITNDDIDMDYNQNTFTAGLQWTTTEKLNLELRYQIAWARDNHLDKLVKAFHNTFGLKLDGRNSVEDGSFNIDSDTFDIHYNNFESDILENSISLYLQYPLYETNVQALAVGGSIYYNNENNHILSSNGLSQSIQVNWSYLKKSHSFHSTLGVVFYGTKHITNDLYFKSYTWGGGIGYGYQFLPNHEIIAQYTIYEGALNKTEFSKNIYEATLGYRYTWNNSLIELSGTENLLNMDNSTDIAFNLSFRRYY